MGIPLRAGRNFDVRDTEDRQRVVIISESMARAYWPGVADVIGIVGDVKHLALDETAVPMFCTPHTQQPSYHTMWMVVRAEVPPASLTGQVRAELSQMEQPGAAVAGGHPVDDAEEDRGAATDARHAGRPVRRAGDASCRDWRSRRGGVPGRPAHAGNRRAARAGRAGG